jgi:hypothetical protein
MSAILPTRDLCLFQFALRHDEDRSRVGRGGIVEGFGSPTDEIVRLIINEA